MPRPRKLPDADVLHQLRSTGTTDRPRPWTYDEIAAEYGVTRAAVHLALKKSGLVTPAPRYRDEIPWVVAESDNGHYIVSMLRMAARMRRGEPVPAYRQRFVERWVQQLKDNDVVVDYVRDYYIDPMRPEEGVKQGWGYVKARPGIDTWLIREPDAAKVA